MLATRISLHERAGATSPSALGADIEQRAPGHRLRPAHRLRTSSTPAPATAARCFPKDVKALIHTAARARRRRCSVLQAVEDANDAPEAACWSTRSSARFGERPRRAHDRAVGPGVQAQHRRHARGAAAA
ncbi:MAG: hypothetical protein MZW92_47515 [Comamonadaceae bacterium]|nr:hypothetical protein [Comamonadaceae bacterium]